MKKAFLIFCCLATQLFGYSPAELAEHTQKCIDAANQHRSKLATSLLQIHGMSSDKNRHFLNNVCSLEGINYLEVGVWKGSTFFSALYENMNIRSAIAIENWSLDPYTRNSFFSNLHKYKNKVTHNAQMIESDCFTVPLSVFKENVQVYFYDGRHDEVDQIQAFTYFDSILDDVFIAIVDDWNHHPVQTGTRLAFEALGYTVYQEWILPANFNGDLEQWWNGLYVAVIKKH